MQIQMIGVTAHKIPGKKYEKLEVAYKNDKGEIKGRNVMSFGIKNGLDLLKTATPGTMLDVDLVKEGEYWNWVGVKKAGDAPAANSSGGSSSGGGNKYPSRDFETKEERAAKQRLIIRQNCVGNAIAMMKTDKVGLDIKDVLAMAAKLEQFIIDSVRVQEPVAETSEESVEVE